MFSFLRRISIWGFLKPANHRAGGGKNDWEEPCGREGAPVCLSGLSAGQRCLQQVGKDGAWVGGARGEEAAAFCHAGQA